jgi:hypothetical protein
MNFPRPPENLFEWVLRNSALEVVLISPQALLGEGLQEIHAQQPAAVCVMNLAGSECPAPRQFVRRLRADSSALPLVVARLGAAGTLAPNVRDIFRDAGATAVTRTLQETAAAVLPYAIGRRPIPFHKMKTTPRTPEDRDLNTGTALALAVLGLAMLLLCYLADGHLRTLPALFGMAFLGLES